MEVRGPVPEAVRFSLQNLTCAYSGKVVVRGVSLDIPASGVTAFIGPSGCGKSTILRCLNRMNDVVPGFSLSGRVLLDGEDLYGDSQDPVLIRRRVGMVFQRSNPFPTSIFNNVAYGLKLHFKLTRAELELEVEQALRAAALWDEVKDRLHTPAMRLSGGQQQRLCLARALAVKPEVMLFDEPASALDPVATAKVEELVMELGRQMTVVIVTHNLAQASRVADRTAFFLRGELIEFNRTVDLFTNPQRPETEAYLLGRVS
ncbi:phosphate ABC transporter ATP-binding protein PstB [Thermoanaerobaculum aquaticum]|uniref:phosphate ABC transporter ATP-binding protein PstB n=1 Tax=Thermoanaerobaculum aquaticum TaxID=1312852 RepID=UPI00057117F8|nr:MAG: phosphate import ATP-binding protein PstB [Thermoanaerobaculum sp.]